MSVLIKSGRNSYGYISPPPSARLNSASAMCNGLTRLFSPDGTDLVSGRRAGLGGTIQYRTDGLLLSTHATGSFITRTVPTTTDMTVAVWFKTTQTSNFNLIARVGGSLYIGSQSTTTMLFYNAAILLNPTVAVRDGLLHLAVATVGGVRGANNWYCGVDGYVTFGLNSTASRQLDACGYDSGTTDQLVGSLVSVASWSRAMSDADVWALYDPATRWDLYWVPGKKVYFDIGSAPPVGGRIFTLAAEGGLVGPSRGLAG